MKSKFFPTGVATDLKFTRQASATLDLIRAVAAMLVMLSHWRALFFVDYPLVAHPNPLVKAFYLVTGLGHQSVIVFFVLSGLFISASIIKMYSRNAWSWKTYLLQRLSRLWVVLIPALLLTVFWDSLGLYVFHFKEIYSGTLPSDQFILANPVEERLGIACFLSNAFFLQTIATPAYGSNGPLWSLAYEFWYYIAFPCALLAATANKWPQRVGYFLAVIIIGVLVGKDIALLFGIWLLGFAVLFLPHQWNAHKPVKSLWIAAALIPFALALVVSVAKKSIDLSYPIAILFTVLLYLILRMPDSRAANLQDPVETGSGSRRDRLYGSWSAMAGFSYSLYLLHLPPLVFLHAYLHSLQPQKWQPTPANLIPGIVIICGVTGYAWLVSLITEKKTPQFRAALQSMVDSFARRTVQPAAE